MNKDSDSSTRELLSEHVWDQQQMVIVDPHYFFIVEKRRKALERGKIRTPFIVGFSGLVTIDNEHKHKR